MGSKADLGGFGHPDDATWREIVVLIAVNNSNLSITGGLIDLG